MKSKPSFRYQPIREAVNAIAATHAHQPDSILEVLLAVQKLDGSLTRENISEAARALHLPPEKAFGVATFYTMLSLEKPEEHTLRLCDGPVCWLHNAGEAAAAARRLLPGWTIKRNSCLGLCDRAPSALIDEQQSGNLTSEKLEALAAEHATDSHWHGTNPRYTTPLAKETRVMLADTDKIDPYSLESARQHGAYAGLEKVTTSQQTAQQIIETVKAADLRGRGGAGFPVGMKWGFVAGEQRSPKYVVCNADESEPLVFKDRVLIESKPHQLLEGMAIAGYAIGAQEGYIYIRGEYKQQADLLKAAIAQATEQGFLGEHICGSGFSFHIHVHCGAGAYICGEETALLESLEGRRGEPRIRPPYPTTNGYRGLPTLVNNVETFCAIPALIRYGEDWYRQLGPSSTPGTKIFALTGHINRPGVFEAVYGLTLRELIEEFGGGMRPGARFHFAVCGGAAGTLIPENLLDVPLDYAASKKGVSLGAGAFLVCDGSISPVAMLRELMHFFESESCGKCTPCRMGTKMAREALDEILAGRSIEENAQKLAELGNIMGSASFCGLGQSTLLPIQSTLKNFPHLFTSAQEAV